MKHALLVPALLAAVAVACLLRPAGAPPRLGSWEMVVRRIVCAGSCVPCCS